MKKLLFLFNPHAGTGKIGPTVGDVADVFTKAGFEVTVYPTQAPGDGRRKVLEDGPQYDRVVVAGGDGMFHELVDAVARLPEPVTVGYLPAGTVNDFAAAHGLPKDPRKAARIAVGDHIAALDVGQFNDSYFSYVAAFGMVTQVAYQTDQGLKNKLGPLAYLLEVLQSIDYPHFAAACRPMAIETENETLSGEYIFGAVTNSTSIAGMKNFIGDGVRFDDGLLEGLFVRKPESFLELEQMKKGLVDRNFNAPCLVQLRSERFIIQSEPVAWTLDGEDGGEHSEARISACQRVLHIALPDTETEQK